MHKFTFNYWKSMGRIGSWECVSVDFPTAYKAFWQMVDQVKLWKKLNRPVQLDSVYQVVKTDGAPCRVLVDISIYSDEQLGITESK